MFCLFCICGVWCDYEIGIYGNEIVMFLMYYVLIICRNNVKIFKVYD